MVDPGHVHVLFQVQEKLLLSSCHLLVSLATTVRPVFLISIPAVQKVFNRITDTSAQRLPDKVMFDALYKYGIWVTGETSATAPVIGVQ